MPKKGANINLKGYDDLFSTEESRAEARHECSFNSINEAIESLADAIREK